ncbi:hypothetical protein F4802DRAFT_574558 [Xylaria palmicola]|nr:hypothetical protein F4802DRAFT_574558 [Xylaria palmicola]
MHETQPAVLLERKPQRLRRKTPIPKLGSKFGESLECLTSPIRITNLPNLTFIIVAGCVGHVNLYGSRIWPVIFTMCTALEPPYRAGLTWAFGTGELVVYGALSDKILKKRMAANWATHPKPERRSILMTWSSLVVSALLNVKVILLGL